MTSKRRQKDVIFDQTGVQNGINIGLGGYPRGGSEHKVAKEAAWCQKSSCSGSHFRPSKSSNWCICTLFLQVFLDLIFRLFFESFFVYVFWNFWPVFVRFSCILLFVLLPFWNDFSMFFRNFVAFLHLAVIVLRVISHVVVFLLKSCCF